MLREPREVLKNELFPARMHISRYIQVVEVSGPVDVLNNHIRKTPLK